MVGWFWERRSRDDGGEERGREVRWEEDRGGRCGGGRRGVGGWWREERWGEERWEEERWRGVVGVSLCKILCFSQAKFRGSAKRHSHVAGFSTNANTHMHRDTLTETPPASFHYRDGK